MMKSIAANPFRPMLPDRSEESDVRLPYFSVVIDREGALAEVLGGFYDLSDEEQLSDLVEEALSYEAEAGILTHYNMRYCRMETPRGLVVVFSDITSEQATLREMIRTFVLIGMASFVAFLGISWLLASWAVKPVEKAWQQQKQFVADASHELKTPLTVILTDASLLSSSSCTEAEQAQLSGSILTMSEQMRGLVENMLELARIDSGNVRRIQENQDFSEITSTAAMQFEPLFFEKDKPFSYEVEPGIQVRGNGAQLKQVIDILLDNAGKYASPGGETCLTLKRGGHKGCLLEVANAGDPIPEEDLKNLFKRFYRADKARAMNHSYGLGLSIALSITEEHKGRIWAESKNGMNRFFVELPTV